MKALSDTGPLVGYLNRSDQHHAWAVEGWSALFDPLWTCESVLSEAVFALQSEGLNAEPVFRLYGMQDCAAIRPSGRLGCRAFR